MRPLRSRSTGHGNRFTHVENRPPKRNSSDKRHYSLRAHRPTCSTAAALPRRERSRIYQRHFHSHVYVDVLRLARSLLTSSPDDVAVGGLCSSQLPDSDFEPCESAGVVCPAPCRPAYRGLTDGSGLSANFSSVASAAGSNGVGGGSAAGPARPPASFPAQAVPGTRTVAVRTLAELAAAAADPAVAHVAVSADIHFPPGSPPLAVAGPGRTLLISSDGPLCPGGRCALDGSFASQLLRVSNGASVELRGLALRRCAAVQGGCAAVVGAHSALSAVSCSFQDARAASDGGAVLALGGARVTVSGSDFSNCTSIAGSGGAIAAHFGSTATIDDSTFTACGAQWGGAVSGLNRTTVSVTSTTFSSNWAWYGGAVGVRWWSTDTISNCTFVNNSAYRDGIGIGGASVSAFYSTSTVSDVLLLDNSAARGAGVGAP